MTPQRGIRSVEMNVCEFLLCTMYHHTVILNAIDEGSYSVNKFPISVKRIHNARPSMLTQICSRAIRPIVSADPPPHHMYRNDDE